ncbi:MAG: alpha-E domain-containing protein [Acidisphaera sp.]|nr:alpha-E domain-containing protein [Acidisphaera sp.]
MSETLLARYADCVFWLARYVERVENLARILDVNETFSRDSRGSQNWLSIVQLFSDEKTFSARHAEASAENVLHFYVRDTDNPSSIVSGIAQARENARTLRPLISTEMWVQLNMFHNRLGALGADELSPGRRNRFFGSVKEACQTHTGITEGTLHRDQVWYFYQIGRYVERADQTTRLLDMKYHLLLPRPRDVGSPIDVSQWNALLRSAAGYHAYRRLHSGGITPAQVAGFLLLNRRFPRSVYLCIRQTEMLLAEMKARYALRGGNDAAEVLDGLRALFSTLSITEILKQGLHEFLDLVQLRLIAVSRHLSIAFFGYQPEDTLEQLQQTQ